MDNLSVHQALDIWSELEQAYHGTNGYGGDTAEIYFFRLMPHDPSYAIDPMNPSVAPTIARANVSLYNLLSHFAERRSALVEVEGRVLGDWLCTALLYHRVHVRVRPLENL